MWNIADVFVQIGVNGLSSVSSALNSLKSMLSSIGQAAGNAINNLAGTGGVIGNLAKAMSGIGQIGSGVATMLGGFGGLLQSLSPVAYAAGRAVSRAFDFALLNVPSAWIGHYADLFRSIGNLFVSAFAGAKGKVGSVLSSVASAANNTFASLTNSRAGQAIANGLDIAKFAVKGLATDLKKLPGQIAQDFSRLGSLISSNIKTGLSSAFGFVDGKTGGALSGIAAHARQTFHEMQIQAKVAFAAINAQIPRITSAFGTMGAGAARAAQGIASAFTGVSGALGGILAKTIGVASAFLSPLLSSAGSAETGIGSRMRQAGAHVASLANPVRIASTAFTRLLLPSVMSVTNAVRSLWATAMGPIGWLANALFNLKGAIGLALGGASTALLGKKLVDVTADAEQASVAFEVMLGSASKAKGMLAQIQELADKTPLELPEVRQGARNLLAMNVAGRDIVPTLRMLGDVAQGLQIPLNDLVLIYGKIAQKNRVMGDDLRQFGRRGIPVVRELSKQFGVSTEKIYEMASNGKIHFGQIQQVFRSLTQDGGQFHNMMERMSKTLPGLWSTLRDSVRAVAVAIGTTISPAIQGAMSYMIAFTNKTKESIGPLVHDLKAFAEGFTSILPRMMDGLSSVAPVFMQAIRTAVAFGKAAGQAFSLVVGRARELVGGFEPFTNTLMRGMEMSQFLAEEWQIVFLIMTERVSLFGQNVSEAFSSLMSYLTRLSVWFANSWQEVFGRAAIAVFETVKNLTKNIREAWRAVMEFIKTGKFEPKFSPIFKEAKEQIDAVLKTMPKMADGVLSKTTPLLERLKKELDEAWAKFQGKIQDRENFKVKVDAGEQADEGGFGEPAGAGRDGNKKVGVVGLMEFSRQIQQYASSHQDRMEKLATENNKLLEQMADQGIKVKNLGRQGAIFA
jgi:tape measure domain-containing protein